MYDAPPPGISQNQHVNEFETVENNIEPEEPKVTKEIVPQVQEPQKTAPKSLSHEWEKFVKYMGKTSYNSLVSLLRNSVLLNLTEQQLEIGYSNTKVFSKKKRDEIEEAAKSFFNKSIQVSFKSNSDGLDDSVSQKEVKEKLRRIEKRKEDAENSEAVQAILKLFPGSEIQTIEIKEEKENV